MNILILHTARFDAIAYDRGIDHDAHHVVYVAPPQKLDELPAGLPCTKLARPGTGNLYDEVEAVVVASGLVFDFLISVSEYELLDAARLRQRFGIPGPQPQQAEKIRNKAVMKRHVAAAGIAVPRFAMLDAWLGAGLPIGAQAAVIIKPIDGASSLNVVRFDNQAVLRAALAARSTGIAQLDEGDARHYARFEVEEYVPGSVIHIDGVTRQGELLLKLASRKVNSCLDFANGKPMGSVQMDDWAGMDAWVGRVLAAVEIRDGAFHLEVIDGPDGIVFLEIAHRVGGGRITETFERKTGIHLSVADLRSITDPDYLLVPVWDRDHYFGWFAVPGHHLGTRYCSVSGYEYLEQDDRLLALNKLGPGQPVSPRVTYVETMLPLAGMLKGDSPAGLHRTMTELFEKVRCRPCHEAS